MDEVRNLSADAPYPYSGPEEFQSLIEAALRQVVDPEIALSIVDVGLVYAVNVSDGRVHVRMTMTSAACPVADLIVADVNAELDRVLPADFVVDVELVWDPFWTPDRMSARAKDIMGW
jgi:metal-sulfur cluster biosynthetic enzyme